MAENELGARILFPNLRRVSLYSGLCAERGIDTHIGTKPRDTMIASSRHKD